jgi:hypothetical protein
MKTELRAKWILVLCESENSAEATQTPFLKMVWQHEDRVGLSHARVEEKPLASQVEYDLAA